MEIQDILSTLNSELNSNNPNKKLIISNINLLTKNYNQLISNLKEKQHKNGNVSELKDEIKVSDKKYKKKVIDLNTIFEIAKELSSSLNLDNLMKIIILTSIGHMLVESGVLFIYDEKSDKYIFSEAKGIKKDFTNIEFTNNENLIQYLKNNLKPIEIRNFKNENFYSHYQNIFKKLNCELIVPIYIKNRLNGILFLGTKVGKLPFTDSNIEFLVALGNFASIAIENAKLYEDIDRKMQDLSTLYNISKEINKSFEINIAINLMLETITTGFGVKKCSIILYDELKKIYHIEKNYNISDKESKNYFQLLQEGKLKNPLEQNEPDISYDNSILKNGNIYLSIPLIAGNRKVGLLNIYEFSKNIVVDEDVKQIFSIIASQMAPPILLTQYLSKRDKYKENPFDYIYHTISDSIDKSLVTGMGFIITRIILEDSTLDLIKIKKIEEQIKTILQETDILIHSNFNEFILIFPATSKQEIQSLLDTIITSLTNIKMKYTIYAYPDNGDTVTKLLNKLFL